MPPLTITCTDPATGSLLGPELPAMTPEEVRACVARARTAQRAWAKTSFAERRRVLRRFLQVTLDHTDEICELIVRDAGKTRENALLGEILPVCEKLRHTINTGERHLRPERVSSGILLHKVATIEYHPLGVIGVISPWNFPFQNILGPLIPALFAGNAVVTKVSEWTSQSSVRFGALLRGALRELGHDPELIQILTGFAETGAALVRSGVEKIIFTGSVANGRKVVAESAAGLVPLILELGGKDPMIICDDADLEQAVAAALAGAFIASGQMCLAAERVIVLPGIYDRFVQRVVEEAQVLRQGPPLAGAPVDVGAMTMPGQVDIVDRLVSDAVARGARALCGGRRGEGAGSFYRPTVLVDVPRDALILREETFGPVLCVVRAHDEEDAIALANGTEFGLGSTVFTRDHARGKRIADRLVAGSTILNDFGVAYLANDLPFGGVKHSGYGRLNGREGLRACTNIKSVVTDRFPLHLPSRLFPVQAGDYEVGRGAIELLYRRGLRARLQAALRLFRAFFQREV